MSSILVNTTDFYKFAEELANDFNLNCAESEEDQLSAESFYDEVRDINNEQIESVKSYLDWFDCYAITESFASWRGHKTHTVITSDIDNLFDAIGKYDDVIISQDNGKIVFELIDHDGSNVVTVQPLKHDKRHIDDIRQAYQRSVKRHGSGAKWIKYFRFIADFYTDAHE
jgi:hypothetical protein